MTTLETTHATADATPDPASCVYRTWVLDSRRWNTYRPRSGDIVIATYPKCGTTWMQRIVSLLIFQSPEPRPVMDISPWIDRRFGEPMDEIAARIEAQTHRRFLKSHLPLDGLPFYPHVRYIHVARDGRDAAMSYHNHASGLTEAVLATFDRIGFEDETIGRPYPRMPADPADYFHRWVRHENVVHPSFFHFEKTWWEARQRPNVLFVHFNDLKADLPGEMRRIARFLGIEIGADRWPDLVTAAGFDAMQREGDVLLASVGKAFRGGGKRFFFKGSNDRWRGIFREADLTLYKSTLAATVPPACADWITHGRLGSGDPRSS